MALGTSVGKDVLELRECDYMVLSGAESPCKCIKGIDSIIGSNKNQSYLALQTVIPCLEC